MALETKNLDIVTALLDGAPTLDMDQIDMDGMTPLLRACKVAYESGHGTVKLVRELLSNRNADINLNAKCPGNDEKHAGMTALHLSALILSEAEESNEDIIDEEDNIFSHGLYTSSAGCGSRTHQGTRCFARSRCRPYYQQY